MSPNTQLFLDRWHRIVAERDLAALREILAEDVSIGAPPYWPKLQGRDLVCHLLGIIIHTIEDFTTRLGGLANDRVERHMELMRDKVMPALPEFSRRLLGVFPNGE